jgi:hypothetical protein
MGNGTVTTMNVNEENLIVPGMFKSFDLSGGQMVIMIDDRDLIICGPAWRYHDAPGLQRRSYVDRRGWFSNQWCAAFFVILDNLPNPCIGDSLPKTDALQNGDACPIAHTKAVSNPGHDVGSEQKGSSTPDTIVRLNFNPSLIPLTFIAEG